MTTANESQPNRIGSNKDATYYDRAQQGVTLRALRSSAEIAREGLESGYHASHRATDGVVEQVDQATRQFATAAEVYSTAALRIAEEVRSLVAAPLAAVGAMQDVSRAWSEWLSRTAEVQIRLPQEMLRVRSLAQFAEVQANFIEQSVTGLREGNARVLGAAAAVAEHLLETAIHQKEDDEERARVADVMTRDVRLASPDDQVQDAAQVMARTDTGVLPVVEDGQVIGMLTDRDLAVRVVAAGRDPAKTKVREAMTSGVEHCFEDDDLDTVVEKMTEQRIRRLPVLSREKRLVGIVSLGDLATGQPNLSVAGRALSGIVQEGGAHRQRPVPRLAATRASEKAAAGRQQRRR